MDPLPAGPLPTRTDHFMKTNHINCSNLSVIVGMSFLIGCANSKITDSTIHNDDQTISVRSSVHQNQILLPVPAAPTAVAVDALPKSAVPTEAVLINPEALALPIKAEQNVIKPAELSGGPMKNLVDWDERAQHVNAGISRAEVEKYLPPYQTGPHGSFEPVTELPRSGSSTVVYLLDDKHQAQIEYLVNEQGLYSLSSMQIQELKEKK